MKNPNTIYVVDLPGKNIQGSAIGGLEIVSAPSSRCATSRALSHQLPKNKIGLGMHILDGDGREARRYATQTDVQVEIEIYDEVQRIKRSEPSYLYCQAAFLASDLAEELKRDDEYFYFEAAKRFLNHTSPQAV
jgi:hypothetical protein